MKINKASLGQFFLVTGDWIIAQILESDEHHYLIDHAVVVEELLEEDYDALDIVEGKQYYLMRPFIKYTDDLEASCALNPISIVSLSSPSESLFEQYMSSCQTIQEAFGNDERPESVNNKGNVVTFKPKH
jgi:hypothetical protein